MRVLRERCGHVAGVQAGADRDVRSPILPGVSTRMLIILALVCGLAILVAFAVQVLQVI